MTAVIALSLSSIAMAVNQPAALPNGTTTSTSLDMQQNGVNGGATTATSANTGQFTSQQKQAIEKIIHDYLMNQPEVLLEVSHVLQTRQREMIMKKAENAIRENIQALFQSKSPSVGNPKGDVTLVEFFDYQCIHCKEVAPVIQQLKENDPNVKVIYKVFPIFGANSENAAKVAMYANEKGKYQAFHDALLKVKGRLSDKQIVQIAEQVGLNGNAVKKVMASKQYDDMLKSNVELAGKLGIMGTPAFVVAPNPPSQDMKALFVPGAVTYEMLQNMVKEVRSGGTASDQTDDSDANE